jgi:TonB-dependent SusC/RagA subfamily outer membrane receptor
MRIQGIMRPLLLASILVAACAKRPSPDPVPPPRDSVQVGYGSQAKRDVTGAIASVDGDAARASAPMTVADMIQGRFPGVEVQRRPGGGIAVRIRGAQSVAGDDDALIVIDGVPQSDASGGALMALNPRDIKSIDVLKDAGSTAIYGSRGANGVVLITTKQRPQVQ